MKSSSSRCEARPAPSGGRAARPSAGSARSRCGRPREDRLEKSSDFGHAGAGVYFLRERPLLRRGASAIPEVAPLPLRLRPKTLDEFVGQEHVLGEGSALRLAIEEDRVGSTILYGPPGSGKTTLARIVANATGAAFEELSAVSATVRRCAR